MKTTLLLIVLLVLASCGSKTTNEVKPESQQEQISGELSSEEKALIGKIKGRNLISQKELAREFLQMKSFNKNTLAKLDRFVDVDCVASRKFCHIKIKE